MNACPSALTLPWERNEFGLTTGLRWPSGVKWFMFARGVEREVFEPEALNEENSV